MGDGLDGYDIPAYQRKKIMDEEELPPEETEPPAAKKGFFKRAFFKDNLDYPTFLRAKAD